MASLTPGVLLKLLQSMNTDTKVVGEHRSAVLQVIGIVPANDDLWPSRGFYLQLSDSLNSTYVSLSDRDADSIQLGQLVHVDRLVSAHPVPRASGLRPIPFVGRSPPHPFVGSTEPLVALSSPSHPDSFVIQPANSDSAPPLTRTVFAPKENVAGPIKNSTEIAPKRRFTSPAGAKLAVRKGEQRDPSPAPTGIVKTNSRPSSPAVGGRGASRASSPVPSKCTVPSLVVAKDENRRVAREPAIVVPSRYRQPSPAGGRKAAAMSPMGRRGSVSPGGRRLSGGLKGSPAAGEGGGKKKMGIVVAGISRVSDALMVSGRSVRKSWEDPSGNSGGSSEMKDKSGSKSKVDQQAILRTQVAISRRLSDAAGEQSNSEEAPTNEKQRHRNKTESSLSEKANGVAPKFTVHDRKWTDGSIPFDTVSDNLARLGKDALQRRNIASIAAAEALEEALATESIIRSLSMFSDLCSSSKPGNPLPTIDRFLSIYDDVMKWVTIAESLAANRSTNVPNEATSMDRTKSASLWVEAALATDLEVLSLLNSNIDGHLKHKCSENLPAPSVDPLRASSSKKTSLGTLAKSQAKSPTNMWTRGYGVGETVNFAKSLRREMQSWFLKFVEDSLDVGFRLFGEVSENGKTTSCKDNGRVAAVLSHLKRVNDWLDEVGRKPEEEMMMLVEKIERLKRKIYGFVITHVGSAFDSSVSLSKV